MSPFANAVNLCWLRSFKQEKYCDKKRDCKKCHVTDISDCALEPATGLVGREALDH